jgi:hypothetical protein
LPKKSAIRFILQWKLKNCSFALFSIQDPNTNRVKSRFEVLFKNIHLRITLLNYNPPPENDMKLGPWGLNSKTSNNFFLWWLPSEPEFQNFKYASWPKWLRKPKFQHSRSYCLGCRHGTNFCWRLTDGKFLLLFSRFMTFNR